MIFEIDNIANVGSVQDVPGYMLPPEVWTLALNMRYADDSLRSLEGWDQIFFGNTIAPHFALPVATPSAVFWLYVSLTKGAMFDGNTHVDITRTVGGDYAAADTSDWNGTLFGGIAVLNNGVDKPQAWIPPLGLTTKLVDLPNWPTTHRAEVIRSFGSFLIAISTKESGVSFPHRVLWSHPADPGAVPPSWDITDPTKDAGEIDLPDVQAGILVDALPLGNIMYVYKEASIWKMRFVGGQSIFDFGQSSWITTAGLLGPRCVCLTGDGTKHVLATQDDIIWHNGSNVQSILNKRQRRRLQNELDSEHFRNSFIFANPFNNEVWFCYPASGFEQPNRALIMNYRAAGGNDFTVTEADGVTFRNAAVGTVESFNPEVWNNASVPPGVDVPGPPGGVDGPDTWNDDTGPWSQLERRRVILQSPDNNKFYKMDSGSTRDGTIFSKTLQRVGLAMIGKKQNGDPIVDHQKMKMLKRLWPKISGGPVDIRFNAQQVVNGMVTWGASANFNPVSQVYIDPGPETGRAVGFEISSQNAWKLDGYKVDVEPLGEY